ncbi:MAG TPA: glycine cleavage system aminomethyltransferase GcvT [Caldilineaceae bacterium]|nr:glycine cleavage system aminomethyltransferase GcvT [Caldilineaceae bacterium]
MPRTLLYDTHVALGGRMVEFAGWELPVQYPAGPLAEHHAVRSAAGLFDIDHMGQFEVRGPDAIPFLQKVQVWDIERMGMNEAHYSLLLYADGTVVDDIFIYRLPERWLVIVNAANRAKDLAWLEAHNHGYDVSLLDMSDDLYMLALQGPKAEQILQPLTETDLSRLATRTAVETTLLGMPAVVGRTGYTGEDGFELYVPQSRAIEVWNRLLESGAPHGLLPCGLAARDSLRFEAAMPLYGHELDATTNPLEARLGWTIAWDKEFIGREALLKVKLEQPSRLLVGFEMVERAVPREHYPLMVDGQVVGHVTSGMKSPTLDKFLGMGYVPRHLSSVGSEFEVQVRGQAKRARVVKRPFYTPRYK